MTPDPAVDQALRDVVRGEWARVVGAVMAQVHDLDIAEDAAQDALAAALEQWPTAGVPRQPGAWLTTVARRRAIDHVRRRRTGAAKQELAARLAGDGTGSGGRPDRPGGPGVRRGSGPPGSTDLTGRPRAWTGAAAGGDDIEDTIMGDDDQAIRDDELRLLFLCCHPALAPESQVALTLRSVAGLTTTEIAHAYLVSEATMAQRLVRAKRKVRVAGIPFAVPDRELLAERVRSVLAVVYLIFNEGYAASSGDALVRTDLCDEAIRLARLLQALLPDDDEAGGLLAMLLLIHARRDARATPNGALVLLEDQDRSRWHAAEMAEGRRVLSGRRLAGPYAIQAGIAAVHAAAPTFAATDWGAIVALYDRLVEVSPSPVVELNRAVAVALADGPAAGLALVDGLAADGSLDDYHLLHTTRADLLRRLGRRHEARAAYQTALALTENGPERDFLAGRVADLDHD